MKHLANQDGPQSGTAALVFEKYATKKASFAGGYLRGFVQERRICDRLSWRVEHSIWEPSGGVCFAQMPTRTKTGTHIMSVG